MKRLLIVFLMLSSIMSFSQNVKIGGTLLTIKHGDLVLYIDKDTNTYVSVHTISPESIKKLDGDRADKWHKETKFCPYKKDYYVHSGYDLGHLTPAHITSYDDSLQYYSFSFFNQAPQLAEFNRGKWKSLESKVEKEIIRSKSKVIVITGVLYDNYHKVYLSNSRIKIPIMYYKILITPYSIQSWVGSNLNGLVTETTIDDILYLAVKNGDKLSIEVSR